MSKIVKFDKDIRRMYLAIFNGYSITKDRNNKRKYNMVFKDLYDLKSGKKANYAVFDCIKNFEKLNLEKGDAVTFRARDRLYVNQLPNFEYGNINDYCLRLQNPTKGRKLVKPVVRLYDDEDDTEEKYYQVKVNY